MNGISGEAPRKEGDAGFCSHHAEDRDSGSLAFPSLTSRQKRMIAGSIVHVKGTGFWAWLKAALWRQKQPKLGPRIYRS